MTIVVPFQATPYVKITSRKVLETQTHNANGVTVVRNQRPVLTFFLDYIDDEGFSCCVWDGTTYDGAVSAAQSWAAERVAVRDHTDECRWRA